MFKNYFKTALRNLWRNKAFSFINIMGLAIGIAACISILLFVLHEKSFDNFHSKNIYRVNEVQKFEGMLASQKVALTMFPMGPTLKNEFPEIINYTRVNWTGNVQMAYGPKRIYFPEMLFVDSTFLQVFDFRLLKGNRSTVLLKPNSIVLTENAAQKLFGNEEAIGKTITHYGEDTAGFLVTGILENIPDNSQFQFDALLSFNTIYKPEWMNNWGGNWLDTYLVLNPGSNPSGLEKKFPAYLKKYLSKDDNWKNYELFLQPLKEVHAGSTDITLDYLNFQKFDKNYLRLFIGIALIVLLIACINFMNLSTASSAERAREVGVRKSIGANRFQLSLQFIGESVFLSFMASILAVFLVELFLPFINNLSHRHLHLSLFSNLYIPLYLFFGTIIIGVVSGLYPAAYLSSFQPSKVLKGSIHTGRNKGTFRNILVIGQFTCAIFLFIATIFTVRQLRYMQQWDPGFVRSEVVTIPLDGTTYKKYDVLKQSLLSSNDISAVTAAQDQLGSHMDQSGMRFRGDGATRELSTTRLIVDPDYLNLYKIQLIDGNNFSKEKSANGKEFILNEALAKELLKDKSNPKLSSLIGKRFGFSGDSLGSIIGIVRDFNFNSLHYKIETMFLYNNKDWGYNNMSVKINKGKTSQALSFIQAQWKNLFPDHPFEYQFLDEHFADLYSADTEVSKMVGVLAMLAIVISCLGLFGLASYSAEKRTKEIGVRKVLGASVQAIVTMLSKDFMRLVLIANIIAWPLAWIALYVWLKDYAYRVQISWWVFVAAGLTALLIALFTISFKAIKAAIANPVNSLRTE